MVKCIIFDCDGVLVDTEKIGNGILLAMAQEHGFEMELEDAYRHFNGRNLKDCFRHIEEAINQKLPENFETQYREKSFEAFKTQVKPMKGVVDFIKRIEKLQIPYCVASSGPVEKIRLNLKVAELLHKFEGKIYSSYQIGSWKPEPGIFLHAAKEMGFEVQDCIVLEDSKAGVKAGISGGFKVYGFVNGFNNEDLQEEGADLFSSYEELSEKLGL